MFKKYVNKSANSTKVFLTDILWLSQKVRPVRVLSFCSKTGYSYQYIPRKLPYKFLGQNSISSCRTDRFKFWPILILLKKLNLVLSTKCHKQTWKKIKQCNLSTIPISIIINLHKKNFFDRGRVNFGAVYVNFCHFWCCYGNEFFSNLAFAKPQKNFNTEHKIYVSNLC